MKKRNQFQIFKADQGVGYGFSRTDSCRPYILDVWELFGFIILSFMMVWFATIAISMTIFAVKFMKWTMSWAS